MTQLKTKTNRIANGWRWVQTGFCLGFALDIVLSVPSLVVGDLDPYQLMLVLINPLSWGVKLGFWAFVLGWIFAYDEVDYG